MARDIKGILSKKGWTGEEVGRALIASLIHDAKNKSEGKNSKPLFTQAEFDRMESSLNDPHNYTTYGVFRDIYGAIVDCFNKGQGLYQQFYNGYYRILMTLEQAQSADKTIANMERYPLIMTQSQYDRIRKAAQDRKRAYKISYRSMVFDMLSYYTGSYTELDSPERGEITTDAPAAIKAALETTKKEPVTNKRILENWNEDFREGYYTLQDGRRSDQMSREEWQEATAKETASRVDPSLQRALKGYKLLFDGAEAVEEAAREAGIALPDGMTGEEIIEELDSILDHRAGTKKGKAIEELLDEEAATPTEWHYYDSPPADLTKYDVISGGGIERYSGVYSDRLLDGVFVDEISEAAQLKEFIADYPALYNALKEDIEARIPKVKELKPAQHGKELFTWGELADLDIAVYKILTGVDDADISEYYAEQEEADGSNTYSKRGRIWRKGIAILANPHKFNLDKNGDYIDEEADPYSELMSIDALTENSERRQELSNCINILLKPALRYLYAYNTLLDIIAKSYAIEDLEYLQLDLSLFEGQLRATNNILYMFYSKVYGDSAEKSRKRALIREIFEPIHVDELKPSPEAVAEMQERINRLGLTAEARKQFLRFDPLIAALMERGE